MIPRCLAIAAIAGTLLFVDGSARAGTTPEQKCRGAKSLAAGQYVACLQKASAKFAAKGDEAALDATIIACEAKFDGAWSKAEAKATKAGKTCLDGEGGANTNAFRNFIGANWRSVHDALAGPGLPPECGNGMIEGLETCEASALGNATCASLGFAGGTLACGSNCTFDTSDCYTARFVDAGLTVRDFQTGLEWSKEPPFALIGDTWCIPKPRSSGCFLSPLSPDCILRCDPGGLLDELTNYNSAPNGTITSRLYGRNRTTTSGGTETEGFAGHHDWRLPTLTELRTLVQMPCGEIQGVPTCADPIFNLDGARWSSTQDYADIELVWVVDFRTGEALPVKKAGSSGVQPVRRFAGDPTN